MPAVLSLWLALPPAARAQQPGTVDPSFGASLGLAGTVQQALVQPDGKILVVGGNRGLIRLNPDGTLDATFNPVPSKEGFINSVALQPDGRIIVAGNFTTLDSTARAGIARLNANGTLDTGFVPGAGAAGGDFYSTIYAVGLQSDGKIIVAGQFKTFDSAPRNHIARLNKNGSLDTGFDPGSGANDDVLAVVVQRDGRIVIGGSFTTFNTVARSGVARLKADGGLDTSFDPGAGANGNVRTLAVEADGKIVIGGSFTTVGQVPRRNIARVNANGAVDDGFDPGTGPNDIVLIITPEANGKILVGGFFTRFDGGAHAGIARLDANGKLDASFHPTAGGEYVYVITLALQSNGNILEGGGFTSVDGMPRNGIARLRASGSLDDTFRADVEPGLNGAVDSLAVQPDGRIIAGGEFTTLDGLERGYIARFNSDGSPDASFDSGAGTGDAGTVSEVQLQPNGKILVLGDFDAFGGAPRNCIARLNTDGSLDTGFDPGAGANDYVSTLALQADGKIVVGGFFSRFDGVKRNGVARLNPNGSLDTGFDPAADAGIARPINVVTVQPDGKVLVGGPAVTSAGIVRLNANGSLDTGFNPGRGIASMGTVYSIVVQSDGKIIVAGGFTSFSGATRGSIVRLNANGSLDPSFNPGTGTDDLIEAVAVQPDGKVVAVGRFSTFDGAATDNIVRLDPDGHVDGSFQATAPLSYQDGAVLSAALQPDGGILVGGDFTQLDGIVRNYIGRLNTNGSVDSTFVPGEGVPDINALALQPADLKVVIGGNFSYVGGTTINALARLNTDGVLDPAFAPGFVSGDTVQAMTLQPDDGDVLVAALVGGDSTTSVASNAARETRRFPDGPRAESQIRNVIRRCRSVNGQFDPTFGATTDGTTLALFGLSGRITLVGGSFGHVNTQISANLGRLNPDGSFDVTFAGSADATVRALAVQGNGGIIVGGDFANVDGVPRSHVARLNANGTLDPTFDPGVGPNGSVNAVYALSSGEILIAGSFSSVDGVSEGGVARLSSSGGLDRSFATGPTTDAERRNLDPARRAATSSNTSTPPSATITSLDVQSDGKVIVGGLFNQLGTTIRHNDARLNTDGSVDPTFNSGSGPNAAVNVLKLQPDGRTLLGGNFSSVEGLERAGAARLLGDASGSSN
jgi:uncharacterized delta-60 repeat protein